MTSHKPSALDPDSFHRFGDLLRYLRRRAQLTQRDLSIAVGYNFAHISRLEQGQRLPDPAVVAAVFVPALQLDNEPSWAQRLIALAEGVRQASSLPDPPAEPSADAAPDPSLVPPLTHVPLLATKLYVPRARPNLVARPRLLSELDRALHVPLTLVAAPAGFGKTTLLAAWLHHQSEGTKNKQERTEAHHASDMSHPSSFTLPPFQVAWLSLDADDNDLTSFVRYLVAAVQTVAPMVGAGASGLAQAAQAPNADVLTHVLINDLALLPHETLLVLDDYHLITTPAIHTLLVTLLDHLPPLLHLVITTRNDPPLPLARLRARGQLVELRAQDVRFSAAEAATFLLDVMKLPLSASDITTLETRTEGWIAGLQLAALAMRNHSDLTGFISAFTGSNRFVVDYLVTEVFARQPPHLQTFLLRTSILGRLCGPLCDAVMGMEGDRSSAQTAYTQVILEELERVNLFLVPLDDERYWYRYHHLFGAMLHERLLQGAPPAEVANLHRRAGEWFASQELIDEALQHLLAAGEHVGAAALVENRATSMLKRDDFITLRRWLDVLPDALVSTRPWLCLARARLAVLAHELEESERWLAYIDQAVVPYDQQSRIHAEALTVQMQICLYRNDIQPVFKLAEEALAIAPADNLPLQADILQRKAGALLWSGQLTAALAAFDQVRQLSEAIGDTHMIIASVSNYTATLSSLAQLRAAERHLRHYIQQFAYQPNPMPIIASLFLEQGEIYYEWNDLERATRAVEEARVRCERANLPRTLFTAHLIQASIAFASGDPDSAQSYLDEARALVQRHQLPIRYAGNVQVVQVKCWMLGGNLQAAQDWARSFDFTTTRAPDFLQIFQLFAWVRVLIAQRDIERASTTLSHVQQHAAAAQQQQFFMQTLILQALAQFTAQPTSDETFSTLERALALAEPENYVRTFVDEGESMAALLRAAHQRGIASPYTARLLRAFPNNDTPKKQ